MPNHLDGKMGDNKKSQSNFWVEAPSHIKRCLVVSSSISVLIFIFFALDGLDNERGFFNKDSTVLLMFAIVQILIFRSIKFRENTPDLTGYKWWISILIGVIMPTWFAHWITSGKVFPLN